METTSATATSSWWRGHNIRSAAIGTAEQAYVTIVAELEGASAAAAAAAGFCEPGSHAPPGEANTSADGTVGSPDQPNPPQKQSNWAGSDREADGQAGDGADLGCDSNNGDLITMIDPELESNHLGLTAGSGHASMGTNGMTVEGVGSMPVELEQLELTPADPMAEQPGLGLTGVPSPTFALPPGERPAAERDDHSDGFSSGVTAEMTRAKLVEARQLYAMELLWAKQAVASRRQYLALRGQLGIGISPVVAGSPRAFEPVVVALPSTRTAASSSSSLVITEAVRVATEIAETGTGSALTEAQNAVLLAAHEECCRRFDPAAGSAELLDAAAAAGDITDAAITELGASSRAPAPVYGPSELRCVLGYALFSREVLGRTGPLDIKIRVEGGKAYCLVRPDATVLGGIRITRVGGGTRPIDKLQWAHGHSEATQRFLDPGSAEFGLCGDRPGLSKFAVLSSSVPSSKHAVLDSLGLTVNPAFDNSDPLYVITAELSPTVLAAARPMVPLLYNVQTESASSRTPGAWSPAPYFHELALPGYTAGSGSCKLNYASLPLSLICVCVWICVCVCVCVCVSRPIRASLRFVVLRIACVGAVPPFPRTFKFYLASLGQ